MPKTRPNPDDPDSPFLTEEAFRHAKTFAERFPGVDPSQIQVFRVDEDGSRHLIEKRPMTQVAIPSELAQELQASGPDWTTWMEQYLRAGLKERERKAA